MRDILRQAGMSGAHDIPKKEGGGDDPRFRVIWMQEVSGAAIIKKAKTHKAILGVAKNKKCFGIRVEIPDFAAVMKVLTGTLPTAEEAR